MEELLSWNVDWYYVAVLAASIIGWVLDHAAKGKYKQAKEDAEVVSLTVYSAIEEANNTETKVLVAKALNEIGKVQPGVKELDSDLVSIVDDKKSPPVAPFKRFWRRALRGENLAGMAARIAIKAMIQELIEKEEEEEE